MIFKNMIEFIKRMFKVNKNIKELPGEIGTFSIEPEPKKEEKIVVKATEKKLVSTENPLFNQIDSIFIKKYNTRDFIKYDSELIELAREHEKLKKEYLKEKEEIERLDDQIKILERASNKKS